MAWKFNDKVIQSGHSWTGTATDDAGNIFEVTHPRNWMIWSDEDKAAAGLVWEDESNNDFDSRFYWSSDNPKSLDDENIEGSIRLGLKSVWILETKGAAGSLLKDTDWYVTRYAETGAAIPDDVSTYRAAVRTAADTIEAAITDAITLEEFVALFEPEVDADGNWISSGIIYAWPEKA